MQDNYTTWSNPESVSSEDRATILDNFITAWYVGENEHGQKLFDVGEDDTTMTESEVIETYQGFTIAYPNYPM